MTRACQNKTFTSFSEKAFLKDQESEWKNVKAFPLHQAAVIGDMTYISFLVDIVGCDINLFDSEMFTPLHRAILHGQTVFT